MNILITGACGGMGHATAALLRRLRHTVFGLDRTIKNEVDGVTYLAVDLTKYDELRQAFLAVSKQVDHLDAIIHFAGIYVLDSSVEIEEKLMAQVFDINLLGIYRVNKAFLPLLGPGSRILITSSELAPISPLPFTGLYGVTKAAVEKYAHLLRMELSLLGIQVSVIRPGAVATPLIDDSTAALDSFCARTKLYSVNAPRFRGIVRAIESRCVPPQRVARLAVRILGLRRPAFIYPINRNPLLLMWNRLPQRVQLWALQKILSN